MIIDNLIMNRHFSNGMAEVIKAALIADKDFFYELLKNSNSTLRKDAG